VARRLAILHDRTAGADGCGGVSPKGDPPGFTLVLNDTTIAIPEPPVIVARAASTTSSTNPQAGLIILLPGHGDTRCGSTAERRWYVYQ